MPDRSKKFHEFALRSLLFKGRADWYFSYLKAEKIAHVLSILAEKSLIKEDGAFENIIHLASQLPQGITHFAAGEMDLTLVLADIFGLLTAVRLSVTEGSISIENGQILVEEYEGIAQKMSGGTHPSPFLSGDDFSIPTIEEPPQLLVGRDPFGAQTLKDIDKGQSKGQQRTENKGHSERALRVLEIVRKNNGISIKDIAAEVKGCSEKTIQRELAALVEQGLIKKQGERRWSIYLPA